MRKLLVAVFAATIVLFAACPSAPRAVSVDPRTSVEEAIFAAIEHYRAGIIFTGASAYTVASGDTLVSIAADLYEDGFFYPLILLASSDVVLDPDRIAPGMDLTIPDLQRNLNNARSRASLRGFMLEIADIEYARGRGTTAAGIRDRANAL